MRDLHARTEKLERSIARQAGRRRQERGADEGAEAKKASPQSSRAPGKG